MYDIYIYIYIYIYNYSGVGRAVSFCWIKRPNVTMSRENFSLYTGL